MTRRSQMNDYSKSGMYHITLHVNEALGQPLGCVVGDVNLPDDADDAPRVELTTVGSMVKEELLNSIGMHYPMVEVQDYIVMPEHLHFIVNVHDTIVSETGRQTHLGHVIAGFKKGCNRRYWALTGQSTSSVAGLSQGKPAVTDGTSCPAVRPQGCRVPSTGSTGRIPLFAEGYVDVMPLHKGQLAQQRQYIRSNPRSRLLRSINRSVLQPQRNGIDTALSFNALLGYLRRECLPSQLTTEVITLLQTRPLINQEGRIECQSYGDRQLLESRLLPVVCHRCDAKRFAVQKAKCLAAAQNGAVLVSARIAKGEQEIMDAASAKGFPVIIILDNGMPERYHPSEERIERCLNRKLLLLTPWQYQYRMADETIRVVECKTMNCVVQAICRLKDSWWKADTSAGKTS